MTQNNYEALQNLKAKAPHEADDVTGVGGDETVSEALSKNVFSSYVCTSVKTGVPHPGDIAEPTSLRQGINLLGLALFPDPAKLSSCVAAVPLHFRQLHIHCGTVFQQMLFGLASSVSCNWKGVICVHKASAVSPWR